MLAIHHQMAFKSRKGGEMKAAAPQIVREFTDHTSFTTRSTGQLQISDMAIGVAGLTAWILLFTAGSLIASEPYRKQLSGSDPLDFPVMLRYGVIVFSCYTVTNVAMLCCLSSLLGGLYRGSTRVEPGTVSPSVVGVRLLPYLIQGFVIFLLIVSGLFLLGDDPFANLTQSKYIRLAGSASLFSFIAGYKPRVFYKWLQRFDETDPTRSPKPK
jgi:hypothetical protein